jgi:predicted AlkP superfamily pyrophosphatase or phosphodiesterase
VSQHFLHEVMPSVAAAMAVPGFVNTLEFPAADHHVVVLVDGMGMRNLQEFAEFAPWLGHLGERFLTADFPTTTPVGLGSLGTGLSAGSHGLVGASFELPETGHILAPLHWPDGIPAVMVQPEPTVFEQMQSSGIAVSSVGAEAYAQSGLTQAVLRGPTYLSAQDVEAVVHQVRTAQRGGDRTCVYVYWSALDRIGHGHGVGSDAWIAELRIVDQLLADVFAVIRPGTQMVITADHGMINAQAAYMIKLEEHRSLRLLVRHIAGEPRMRHLYLKNPGDPEAKEQWRDFLGDRAAVLTRQEAVQSGYFGEVGPGIEERIGDLVCIAQGPWIMTSDVDTRVSSLIGQHGGLSDHERMIPCLSARAER